LNPISEFRYSFKRHGRAKPKEASAYIKWFRTVSVMERVEYHEEPTGTPSLAQLVVDGKPSQSASKLIRDVWDGKVDPADVVLRLEEATLYDDSETEVPGVPGGSADNSVHEALGGER
jgi:hypothetical protein